jgi:hypothetical protein
MDSTTFVYMVVFVMSLLFFVMAALRLYTLIKIKQRLETIQFGSSMGAVPPAPIPTTIQQLPPQFMQQNVPQTVMPNKPKVQQDYTERLKKMAEARRINELARLQEKMAKLQQPQQ